MKIRMAVASEAEALVGFNQAMALETEGKTLEPRLIGAGVRAVFDDPAKGFYVVADDDGEIAGGLMVTFEWSDWRNAWFWWIQSVYVLPSHRGRGLYREMYDFVRNLAGEKGDVCGFRLYVEKENAVARKVYEKLGMSESYYVMYEQKSK